MHAQRDCRLHVPYKDFTEFGVLTETFRAELQDIIKTKIESNFRIWKR
jgi:hypothetical protein